MKRKGFTLIELMISISIIAIFSTYIYRVYFYQIKESVKFNDKIDIERTANKALALITDKIRSSTNILVQGDRIISNGRVIIDLGTSSTGPDIYYNSATKLLVDNTGVQCPNIGSVTITPGAAANSEEDMILITVSAADGDLQYDTSTAVNIVK